ncbi:MAG TPA: hypothetical protein DCZ75_15345 [Geobacter sp.]|nr:hypothetical protein [Geobacter sp.]
MKVAMLLVMLTVSAASALAGQGIIEETDTDIVVEYSGEPGERQPASPRADPPAPHSVPTETAPPPIAADPPEPSAPAEVTPPPDEQQ